MNDIEYKVLKPNNLLSDFVESFWMLKNSSQNNKNVVILPDGRFDIIFTLKDKKIFHTTLRGLDTTPNKAIISANTTFFAVSFKLLAIEYLIGNKVDLLLNKGVFLSSAFGNITKDDLKDFNVFCEKISLHLTSLISPKIDTRKQKLFDLIYNSNGTLSVKELSEKVFWSSRQINRYFNQTFGISLKAYCTIFRFKISLMDIKKGKLFPELNFTDQTHFIKEVKKMSGVTPKELSKNENDRFILLSIMSK
ncbi:hypothetical protein Fleli_2425 [Bernardetia litoralis DSM 6794]|uniref:HTH araC/xylS-type domain-containing protein n=1 Tax=Bernardetia litoralis (strain ATCC 23117 / DSM 6794 / NBRC 15988 / NCIMB 1366 / Fx l1 / Sio-4) TaxID=880071 RepID=I4ALF7_BERLS|nr:AraC family transcriptional regulator [Bernardetia litoralis]AFM04792.1 hypothetical protein Fleli_2425 [Bernardetia litoralis DSM 6794]